VGRSARRPGRITAIHVHRTIRCHLLLMCQTTREDRWDRGAIVRGFWAWWVSVVTTEIDGEAVDSRLRSERAPRGPALSMQWLWSPHESRAIVRAIAHGTMCRGRRHPVTLVYVQRRVLCRQCGIRTEPSSSPIRRRGLPALAEQIVNCQSMPTSHAAIRHGVAGGKPVERSTRSCATGTGQRRDAGPRYFGADEIHRRQGRRSSTRALGPCARRGERLAKRSDGGEFGRPADHVLDARNAPRVDAVCTDMQSADKERRDPASTAAIVFDKFMWLQHASAPRSDDVRRQSSFARCRECGRSGRGSAGCCSDGGRRSRLEATRLPRPLCRPIGACSKPTVLREELDHLWTYKARDGVATFCGVARGIALARLPEMESWANVSPSHRWHRRVLRSSRPVRVVESLNTTIKPSSGAPSAMRVTRCCS